MLGLRKTSSTVFSGLTLILFSLAQSMTWAISSSMDVGHWNFEDTKAVDGRPPGYAPGPRPSPWDGDEHPPIRSVVEYGELYLLPTHKGY